MIEKPITVVCYHCLKKFDCNYLGYSVTRECPTCGGLNRIIAPDPKGKYQGVQPKGYCHRPRKLKLR